MYVTRHYISERTQEPRTEEVWVNEGFVVWAKPFDGPGRVRTIIQLVPPVGTMQLTDPFKRVAGCLADANTYWTR